MGRRKKYTGYIYLITNMVNGKRYVGQTMTVGGIERRWREHKSALRNNKHDNKHLQSAWNKYGEENFKFEVLHKLQFSNLDTLQEALNDLEVMYISIWNLLNDKYGYNISSGGSNGNTFAGKTEEEMAIIKKKISEASKGKKLSEETKKKMSRARKGKYTGANSYKAKKVAQYHINGEYIKTWDCISDAGRELNICINSIGDCCRFKYKKAGNYRWSYLNEDGSIPVLQPLEPSKTGPKPVAMYNLNGNYIRTFNSQKEAEIYLCKKPGNSSISDCCRGKQRQAYGYKWKYITQEELEQIQEKEAI